MCATSGGMHGSTFSGLPLRLYKFHGTLRPGTTTIIQRLGLCLSSISPSVRGIQMGCGACMEKPLTTRMVTDAHATRFCRIFAVATPRVHEHCPFQAPCLLHQAPCLLHQAPCLLRHCPLLVLRPGSNDCNRSKCRSRSSERTTSSQSLSAITLKRKSIASSLTRVPRSTRFGGTFHISLLSSLSKSSG